METKTRKCNYPMPGNSLELLMGAIFDRLLKDYLAGSYQSRTAIEKQLRNPLETGAYLSRFDAEKYIAFLRNKARIYDYLVVFKFDYISANVEKRDELMQKAKTKDFREEYLETLDEEVFERFVKKLIRGAKKYDNKR